MKKRLLVILSALTMLIALLITVGCNNLSNEAPSDNLGGNDNNISSGNDQGQEHIHTFSTKWSNDTQFHWYEATCGHNITADKEEHNFDQNNMCSVCKYYTSNGIIFDLVEDKDAYIVKGLDNSTNITQLIIPAIYNDKPVTTIEKYAFKDCKNLNSVTLSPNINYIDIFAFDGCTELKSVFITDLTSWCNIQFKGSKSNPLEYAQQLYLNNELVKNLVIPESITNLDSYAFYNCDLDGISSHSNNTVYKSENNCLIEKDSNRLVLGCKNSVIPDFVTSIGSSAFESCKGLTNIKIPTSVKSIGFDAFKNCTGLTSIDIPSGITSILDDAFKNCISLQSINIPSGILSIRYGVFSGCSSLTSIEIPDGIMSIHATAFAFCEGLTSITIPNSVTSIESLAFVDCRSLTIYCETSEKSVNWDDNWNNSCPIVWDYKNNDIANDGNIYCVADNGLRYALKDGIAKLVNQSVTISGEKIIPSILTYNNINYNVTSINNEAFRNCKNLTSIIIPGCITNIGINAFIYSNNLTIYCEVESKPDTWDAWWNKENRPVIWGHTVY